MTRLFALALTALMLAPAAVQAADDGGFGSQRFSGQAPAALSGDVSPDAIEPAAGEEEDTAPAPETTGAPAASSETSATPETAPVIAPEAASTEDEQSDPIVRDAAPSVTEINPEPFAKE